MCIRDRDHAVPRPPTSDIECRERGPHRERHRAEMNRDVPALPDDMSPRIEQGARQIRREAEKRRERGPHDHGLHLGADGIERAADHLERHRIAVDDACGGRGHRPAPVSATITCPLVPTCAT